MSPLRDAADTINGLIYLVHDVTSFRELETELRHANEERQSALEELQTSNEELKIEVALPELPPVLGTVAELSHVFLALLGNARDAMPSGGAVEIRGERRGQRVVVTVRDHGPGIASEHLPQVFEPFFTTKGAAGTGVGLWLAASSIRRFGGTISARNVPGGGAEFRMELPAAQVQRTWSARRSRWSTTTACFAKVFASCSRRAAICGWWRRRPVPPTPGER